MRYLQKKKTFWDLTENTANQAGYIYNTHPDPYAVLEWMQPVCDVSLDVVGKQLSEDGLLSSALSYEMK